MASRKSWFPDNVLGFASNHLVGHPTWLNNYIIANAGLTLLVLGVSATTAETTQPNANSWLRWTISNSEYYRYIPFGQNKEKLGWFHKPVNSNSETCCDSNHFSVFFLFFFTKATIEKGDSMAHPSSVVSKQRDESGRIIMPFNTMILPQYNAPPPPNTSMMYHHKHTITYQQYQQQYCSIAGSGVNCDRSDNDRSDNGGAQHIPDTHKSMWAINPLYSSNCGNWLRFHWPQI